MHAALFVAVALAVSLAILTLFLAFPAGGCDAPLCGPMQQVWVVS